MPRRCSVCTHPKRDSIDKAIVAGTPYRAIACQFDVGREAVRRHAEKHLPAMLAKAHNVEEVARADDLLAQVRVLKDKAVTILDKAEKTGKLRTALSGIREARECLSLLAKLLGELDESPKVNILLSPQWIELRKVILMVLEPYPEARVQLAEVLSDGS